MLLFCEQQRQNFGFELVRMREGRGEAAMRTLWIGLATLGLFACSADTRGMEEADTPTSPTPEPPSGPDLAIMESTKDATPGLVQLLANAPQVEVSSVTEAWFHGTEPVLPCVSMAMESAGQLHEGDELDISWLASETQELTNGVYAQQITAQGILPGYVKDGYAHGGHQGLLAITYRPFKVTDGVVNTITLDEYRSTLGSALGSPAQDEQLLPMNCGISAEAVSVHVIRADTP
jgi:hypothetical protein